jgi:hypothetical protein
MLDLGRHRRDDVIGSELDTVAPEDAPAELRRHLGEIGIVLRLVGGQRVVPDTVETAFGINIPKRIEGDLLQSIRLRSGIDGPDVEPPRVLDGPFRVFQYQQFLPGDVLRNALRMTRSRQQERQRHENARNQQKCTNAAHHLPPGAIFLVAYATNARGVKNQGQ